MMALNPCLPASPTNDSTESRTHATGNPAKHSLRASFAALLLTMSLAPAAGANQPIQTQPPIAPTDLVYTIPAPPDQGAPDGRQRGGASRGPCQSFETLTALVPTTTGTVWAMTTEAHPTLWFYLPNDLEPDTALELVVQDEGDRYLYHTMVMPSDASAGVLQLAIPEVAPALDVGQTYTWTLAIYCDPAQPARSVFVTGTIQRTALDAPLQTQLRHATPLEQATLYAEQGIWHDALTILAHEYRANPTNQQVGQLWRSLLAQAGLEDVAIAPFSPCCGN